MDKHYPINWCMISAIKSMSVTSHKYFCWWHSNYSARLYESFVDVQVNLVAVCIVCIAKGMGRFDHWYTCHCLIIRLMEEILHQLGCIKSCKFGINTTYLNWWTPDFVPSTVGIYSNWMTQRSNPTARKNPDGIEFSKFSGRDSMGFVGIGVSDTDFDFTFLRKSKKIYSKAKRSVLNIRQYEFGWLQLHYVSFCWPSRVQKM